jgi:subtilisin family serine protease
MNSKQSLFSLCAVYLLLAVFALLSQSSNNSSNRAQAVSEEKPTIYEAWVEFLDKGVESAEHREKILDELERSFNPRALERRKKRRTLPGLFDERDFPVVKEYLKGVTATGAELLAQSRWLNGVVVRANADELKKIIVLPYVTEVGNYHVRSQTGKYASLPESPTEVHWGPLDEEKNFYGRAETQIEQIGLHRLHRAGFAGRNVIVAVIDTGFDLSHRAFKHPERPIRVVAQWDFMDNDEKATPEEKDRPLQHTHGTYVLGNIASYVPGVFVGSAYEASFILCKAEDDVEEYLLEERWFVAALEYAESQGADVITSSLGLYTGYTKDQLDGKTSVMAQGWNLAVANGAIGVQGGGNFGHDEDPQVHHLFPPADAIGVIAVGAIDSQGHIARFSSDGPTIDGRLKPEVLACGAGCWTVSVGDQEGYVQGAGTSMAAPILAGAVACILQANPDWSVAEFKKSLFHSGDYFRKNGRPDPLFIRGYGIPDAFMAADLKDD